MRYVQRMTVPEHARSNDLQYSDLLAGFMGEWGQALFMLITLGIEVGVFDPDLALELAFAKMDATSRRLREEK